MPFTFTPGDVVAGLALILSAYAIWTTSRFNKRQISLIESQQRLNELLLQKGESEVLDARKADLGASFIKLGSSNYRLKIWNKGKASARDVRIDFPDGNDVVPDSEIEGKFPLESLEQYQSVELIAAVSMDTKSKHAIRLAWSDDCSEKNEKTVYPTI
jgi:hypothetical protein